MDMRNVPITFFVGIVMLQGLHHEALELPSSEDTPALSDELRAAARIVEADLHSHKEKPSGLDQPMGQEADDASISGGVSVPLFGQEMALNRPVRRYEVRYEAGVQPTPFPLRF